jgi:hypothetical protein
VYAHVTAIPTTSMIAANANQFESRMARTAMSSCSGEDSLSRADFRKMPD